MYRQARFYIRTALVWLFFAPGSAPDWLHGLAGLMILAAVTAFLAHIWRRIRPFMMPPGQADGARQGS